MPTDHFQPFHISQGDKMRCNFQKGLIFSDLARRLGSVSTHNLFRDALPHIQTVTRAHTYTWLFNSCPLTCSATAPQWGGDGVSVSVWRHHMESPKSSCSHPAHRGFKGTMCRLCHHSTFKARLPLCDFSWTAANVATSSDHRMKTVLRDSLE